MDEPTCSIDELVRRRLATQRVTGSPLPDPVEVVRSALCVQAQDGPLARYSIGLRVDGADDVVVQAAIDDGRLIRTHLLRPTWHLVAAEDLRWLIELTSAKVLSSLAGRHRRIGVDLATIERSERALVDLLGGQRFATAAEVGEGFAAAGLTVTNAGVRHLLLVAEVRGLICSGPIRGSTHTYALVDERVPQPTAAPLDRDDAIRSLVQRFFRGHGPASEQDLRRWTTLTLAEIRTALAELDDMLETLTCEGATLWFDPQMVARADRRRLRAALLPTFDEAYLPYEHEPVRVAGHPRGDGPHAFAEAGGGVVIVDGLDAGWWKRTVRGRGKMAIRLALATGLDPDQRQAVLDSAAVLAAFFDRQPEVELVDP